MILQQYTNLKEEEQIINMFEIARSQTKSILSIFSCFKKQRLLCYIDLSFYLCIYYLSIYYLSIYYLSTIYLAEGAGRTIFFFLITCMFLAFHFLFYFILTQSPIYTFFYPLFPFFPFPIFLPLLSLHLRSFTKDLEIIQIQNNRKNIYLLRIA